MNHWTADGAFNLHVFHKNNELAGYCSVLQAMELAGITGPLAAYLAENDIIVNCTFQDTARPLTYLHTEDLAAFRPGSLIVDVSCDAGMGFSWARPTTFEEPSFVVGDNILYYAVDHSPSYLWNSATWENSNALMPFLRPVLEGGSAWDADETLTRAIEIRDGRVLNRAILAFQGRASDPPYAVT